MNKLTDTFKINNGVEIPCIGYGTWRTPDGDIAYNSVKSALDAGYRHIDAASAYKNEASVGRAIKASGVKRDELFVTGKVWNLDRGYDKTIASFEKSLVDLQLDYLDLYLIHWPASKSQFENWEEINLSTWSAITDLYKSKKIRAIGVSNFLPHHLKALLDTEIPPMVDQLEFHPGQIQEETVKFCRDRDIFVEAYSPLGTGRMLQNEELLRIASKYNKSVAQLCIRWCLQNGVLPLPKSTNAERIAQNTQIFNFEISDEDMAYINAMPYFAGSGRHPDEIDF